MGWLRAWQVAAVLIFFWLVAMGLTPEHCNILSSCPAYSDFGIFVLGAPVIAVSVLVALVMSGLAWWRRR